MGHPQKLRSRQFYFSVCMHCPLLYEDANLQIVRAHCKRVIFQEVGHKEVRLLTFFLGCWWMCMFESQWQPQRCTFPQDRPLPSFWSPQKTTACLLVRVPQGFSLIFLGQFLNLGTLPLQVSHSPQMPQVVVGIFARVSSLGLQTFSLLKNLVLGLFQDQFQVKFRFAILCQKP